MLSIRQQVLESRVVAEMMEKSHKELLRDIRKYLGYFAESKIAPGDFFLESQ